jgi:hypothetical protein
VNLGDAVKKGQVLARSAPNIAPRCRSCSGFRPRRRWRSAITIARSRSSI